MAAPSQSGSQPENAPSSPPRRRSLPPVEWPWNLSLSEWRVVVRDVVQRVAVDHVSLTAAALAFYALLAIFPTLIALVTVARLVVDPRALVRFVATVGELIPESGRAVLEQEVGELLAQPQSVTTLGLVASLVTALWGASSGVHSLLVAVDLAYDGKDDTSVLRRRAHSLVATLCLVVFMALVLVLTAVVPGVVRTLAARFPLLATFALGRWPILFALFVAFLTLLYRYAAGRERVSRWNVSGALVGTLGWLLASAGFSFYVSTLASYDRTYGALGGVVVLLFWLYLSSFAVLVGAEVNARIELHGEQKRQSLRAQSNP
jgi:membrane protein